jgi:hypothetical protein
MEPTTVMLIFGVASALIFGPLTARSTERRDKIYGGDVARALNLLACMVFVSIPLTVLSGLVVSIITRQHAPILQVGFGLLGVAFLLILAWSAVEMPARERIAPKLQRSALNTWTEEDARKSGL